MLEINKIHQGDCIDLLKQMDPESVNCCVTSPPYWGLRDYGVPPTKWPEVAFTPMVGLPEITIPSMTVCLGLEKEPWAFIGHIVLIFREVQRVLKKDGTLWLNLGDSYSTGAGGGNMKNHKVQAMSGSKQLPGSDGRKDNISRHREPFRGMKTKNLMGIPWKAAFALQADGWYLRQDIIWHKPNPMPESCTDRCTKAHEYVFLLTKSAKYYCDMDAIKEPAVTFENRPAGIVREREYNYDSKRNNNPEAYHPGPKDKNKKFPAGWEKGPGSHGSFHKKYAKGNSKSFRGGGSYTKSQSFNNSKKVDRETTGNKPNETGLRNKRSVWEIEDNNELISWLLKEHPNIASQFLKTNKHDVWTISTKPFKQAHFATFPPKLIEPCIRAGCPKDGIVLDPFAGAGTTPLVSLENNCNFIGLELDGECIKEIANPRIKTTEPDMF